VGGEYFPPLLLVLVFVLDGPLCDVDKLVLSGRVDILELKFLFYHVLEVSDVFFSFESLPFEFKCQSVINFGGPIFTLYIFLSFLLEDVQLFSFVLQFFLKVVFSLVVNYFVGFMSPL